MLQQIHRIFECQTKDDKLLPAEGKRLFYSRLTDWAARGVSELYIEEALLTSILT